jgi:hypothetical protein
MKYLIYAMVMLILLTLAGSMAYGGSYTFVIEHNKKTGTSNNMKTFVIWQKPSGMHSIMQTKMHTRCARKRNLWYEHRDKKIDDCVERITDDWRRVIGGKVIYGYDEYEDWDLKWKLRNRAWDGKKIC